MDVLHARRGPNGLTRWAVAHERRGLHAHPLDPIAGVERGLDACGFARGGFPALNVGGTPQSVEIYAYVPGVDPAGIEVNLERGVLTISGERKSGLGGVGAKDSVHIEERFTGKFRRVITLSDDLDPDAVEARCRDGLLHISIKRKAAAQPRRISIQ